MSGYPTLKIFRNGDVAEDYNGPREAGELLSNEKMKIFVLHVSPGIIIISSIIL